MSRNRLGDSLTNANQARAGQAAMEVIIRLQNYAQGEQVIAACATFLFLAEHYGVSAQDAFTVTKNLINDAPRRQLPEFRAVKMYVENEL